MVEIAVMSAFHSLKIQCLFLKMNCFLALSCQAFTAATFSGFSVGLSAFGN